MVAPVPARHELIASRRPLPALAGALSPAAAARVLLCVPLLSLAVCGCNGPAFTKLFTTEHFDYYVEEGVPSPCDGTEQWLERYYNANAKFLGAPLPPGERIEYYVARTAETLGCSRDTGGCTGDRTIRSLFPVYAHEIVHANGYLLGHPPALFDEGLAVALGCQLTTDDGGPVDTSDPIEHLVETGAFTDWREANGFRVYGASADFVRYLIDRFGSSRFLSFYAQAPQGASRQEIEAVFQDAMGKSLDDAFSDWRTKPPPYLGDLCLRLMECDASMPSLTEGAGDTPPSGLADTEVTLGCGPSTATTGLYETLLRFDVPNERTFRVVTEPLSPSNVGFFRCSGGDTIGFTELTARFHWEADGNFSFLPGQKGSAFALDVPPGEYVAWFTGSVEDRIHLDVEERRSPMRNTVCQAAEEPLALDDKHPTTLTTRWIERPCQGPWCPGQSWDVSIGATGGALEVQAIVVNGEANLSPGELYICSEPCPQDASHCEVVVLDPQQSAGAAFSKQVFEPGAVLHLGAPSAPFVDHFAVRLRVAPE